MTDAARIVRLRDQLKTWALNDAFPLWWTVGADRVNGGFFEKIDLDGSPVEAPRRAVAKLRGLADPMAVDFAAPQPLTKLLLGEAHHGQLGLGRRLQRLDRGHASLEHPGRLLDVVQHRYPGERATDARLGVLGADGLGGDGVLQPVD